MRKTIKTILFVGLFFIVGSWTAFAADANTPTTKPLPKNIQTFIQHMVDRYQFDPATLTGLFQKASYDQEVIDHITHPYEKKPWDIYRTKFITSERVNDGIRYWQQHRATLEYTAKKFGVDPSVIVAIIGVETNYGTNKGSYLALSALYTLAFYYPPRADFFTKELEEFLLLMREQNLSPDNIRSSYAGAIGIPQFMPSAYRQYATRYDSDPILDLHDDNSDSIVSIANFLVQHGWVKGQPVASPFSLRQPFSSESLLNNTTGEKTVAELEALGVKPLGKISPDLKAKIIELDNQNSQPEYWLTFQNFQVIMHYNPRVTYAMAVYQLSRALSEAYEKQVTQLDYLQPS